MRLFTKLMVWKTEKVLALLWLPVSRLSDNYAHFKATHVALSHQQMHPRF